MKNLDNYTTRKSLMKVNRYNKQTYDYYNMQFKF